MLDTRLVPSRTTGSRDLMFVLHGLGDSLDGYEWFPEALRIDRLNYLLVNAPDEYYGGFSWYDFAGDPGPGIRRSRKLLGQLLEAQVAAGFPSAQTFLFGFSQGCLMTLETGLRDPHKLAGLIGISGYVFDLERLLAELSPVAREQRILMTHGTLDPIIPFAKVREQAGQLQAAGLKLEWHQFNKPHTIAGEAELEVIRSFVVAGLKD
jgi:phospholipase/carboxylesterase